MAEKKIARSKITRRSFLAGAVAAPAAFSIVPAHVLGGPDAPSETFGAALIGVGSRGPSTFKELSSRHGLNVRKLAECDVRWVGKADNKTKYTDFRRVLERKDIDIVAIATPPNWHALISIAAMEAGKDVMCEKPMTHAISEGRAVINASKRYGRVFQIGTYGRFGIARSDGNRQLRKLLRAGFAKGREVRYVRRGGFKVKQWSGPVKVAPQAPPDWLDWDMYCGPSPVKPYQSPRFGGMHRGYWDYEGGGLCDMGQHALDPITYLLGKDHTAPVEIETHGPPAHPEATGMWGWSKLKYADGLELVLESGEWGEPTGLKKVMMGADDLTEQERARLAKLPDPEPLIGFGEAVKTRKQPGGHAEAAHRTVCLIHLTNISLRVGRKIRFDPVTEQIVGDEQANRLVNQPMRGPWRL